MKQVRVKKSPYLCGFSSISEHEKTA